MKKIFLALLVLIFLVSPVFAEQIQKELTSETLSASNTDTGWLQSYVGDSDRVAFFVTRDATVETEGVTVEVTLQASVDGVNWSDIKWFDFAGNLTPQVNEEIDADGTYVLWLDRDITMPHVRIKIVASATDHWTGESGTTTCDITVTEVRNK